MNKKIKDGGAAFPCRSDGVFYFNNETQGYHQVEMTGMSLRDYFAAEAMEGDFASQSRETGEWGNQTSDEIILERCRFFYRFADAMIKARGIQ